MPDDVHQPGDTQQQPPVAETPEQKLTRIETELASEKKAREVSEAKAKEHEDNAKFWHERARGSAPQNRDGAPKPAAAEEEDTTDLLELAGKGPKAMKDWLKKQGFVSREEAEQLTNAKASSLVRQAEVVRRFPDLNDTKSEFFKETTDEYQRLKERGVPELVAMEEAAEKVALRRQKVEPKDKEAPAGRQKETEPERQQRARAAGGEGRRGTQKPEESEDLTPEQKHICEQMGITEEKYKERAKAGVVTRI